MFLIILLVIVVGIVNFFYLLPPVINWDEGTHALWGFKEWLALRGGDWHLFWQLSQAQFSYPPLGSWLIALTNLPTEFSLNLARFTSTLGFILGGILLILIAKNLARGRIFSSLQTGRPASLSLARPAGCGEDSEKIVPLANFFSQFLNLSISQYPNILISLFLYLSSPALLFYSVTVFKEAWGMALTLLTIYLFFLAADKKKIIYYLLTGLALTLLFFEKYNYSVLLGLVLGLEGAVETLFNGTNLTNWSNWSKRQLALFLPIILFASWWIFTPDNKLNQFLDIMRSDWNPVTVGVGNSWQYLTFFAQSIRVSYTFSDALFLLIVICYLLSVKDLWQKKIRVLWLFFTLNFVLGILHSINLQDRYILTSVPALFLLVGYEISSLAGPASRFVDRRFFPASIFIVLLVVLVLIDLRNFPVLLKSNATHMLLSPLYNETDYRDTLFDFNKKDWPGNTETQNKTETQKGISVSQKDSVALRYQETPEEVIDYILDNVDITKPINYLGWTSEISPDWVELRRQLKLRECTVYGLRCTVTDKTKQYFVTIEVKPSSRLYTYDYKRANLWQMANIAEFSANNKDKLIKEKDFKELGVVVKIYS